jgi:predicted transcriptional regulator
MKSTLDIRIEEDLKQKLREIAKKRHRSMTQQIERWIEYEYKAMIWAERNTAYTTADCASTLTTEV